MTKAKLTAALPLLIFGLLGLILVFGVHPNGSLGLTELYVGDAVPSADLPIMHGAGARFTTNSWRGRPYIVNFFASWCADCRLEHEELMTLASSRVALIGIAFKDRAEKASLTLENTGNPYVAVAQDDTGRVAKSWGVNAPPETFVIDKRGVIRWHHAGNLTAAIVSDEMMPIVEAVLHEGS